MSRGSRQRQYERAITAMRRAYDALGAIIPEDARSDHTILQLRRALDEYSSYLEGATWWRTPDA